MPAVAVVDPGPDVAHHRAVLLDRDAALSGAHVAGDPGRADCDEAVAEHVGLACLVGRAVRPDAGVEAADERFLAAPRHRAETDYARTRTTVTSADSEVITPEAFAVTVTRTCPGLLAVKTPAEVTLAPAVLVSIGAI